MKKSVEFLSKERHQRLLQHDQRFLDQGYASLAGVDEAGRGPLAGPVVASAVIVRDFSFAQGTLINDSKKMSAGAREDACRQIFEKCDVATAVIGHEVIDRINILQASLLAMGKAIRGLSKKPDCILVDGPKIPLTEVKPIPIVNGDALSFSIACASIVAKVTRDRLMQDYDKTYPQYGFGKHKGYGTRDHIEAIRKNGPCKIHRRSFEPIKSMIKRWE